MACSHSDGDKISKHVFCISCGFTCLSSQIIPAHLTQEASLGDVALLYNTTLFPLRRGSEPLLREREVMMLDTLEDLESELWLRCDADASTSCYIRTAGDLHPDDVIVVTAVSTTIISTTDFEVFHGYSYSIAWMPKTGRRKRQRHTRSSVSRPARRNMGNESSTPVDEDVPPVTLPSRTIEGVAEYIKRKDVKRIVVMTGAGISTSAGIPDFRSPDTGLYANLARLNLPYAEAVFDISYFRDNPLPFYTLAHELYPGQYYPTVTHAFISLLHKKGRLLKLFTQNIDCLEREAGVPDDKIVEAHGSFARQRCIECKTEFPDDKMKEMVAQKTVPHCTRKKCDGLVKPDIVFFGEPLPEAFHANRGLPAAADLAIIMGTSLSVQPFASLPSFVDEKTPRVLINLERVGGLGSRPDDVLLLGDCDDGVRKFADALGWREELEAHWAKTNPQASKQKEPGETETRTKQEELDHKIDELTKDIDKTLQLSHNQHKFLEEHLQEKQHSQQKIVADVSQPKVSAGANTNLAHIFPHLRGEPDREASL